MTWSARMTTTKATVHRTVMIRERGRRPGDEDGGGGGGGARGVREGAGDVEGQQWMRQVRMQLPQLEAGGEGGGVGWEQLVRLCRVDVVGVAAAAAGAEVVVGRRSGRARRRLPVLAPKAVKTASTRHPSQAVPLPLSLLTAWLGVGPQRGAGQIELPMIGSRKGTGL